MNTCLSIDKNDEILFNSDIYRVQLFFNFMPLNILLFEHKIKKSTLECLTELMFLLIISEKCIIILIITFIESVCNFKPSFFL